MKRNKIDLARQLRKNQTDVEIKLWTLLRNRRFAGIKFRRQFPIDEYILDFYAPEYKLGIEADGGQHYEDKGRLRDQVRQEVLSQYGIKILRFSNLDIACNIEGVYEVILRAVQKPLTPALSQRERGATNKVSVM